jgi:K+-sensing histidine kinase KdpD
VGTVLVMLAVAAASGALTAGVLVFSRRRRHAVERRRLSTLMHDLRTPLTSLQLTLGELAHHDAFSDDERATLHRAIEEAVGLRSFLENLQLVDAAAVARPQPSELTAVPLDEQVERLRYRYDLMARTRKVSLEVSVVPVIARADPRLVELLLSNLVEVSLRLTDALVTIELQKRDGGFELICRAPGASLPEPLSVDAFASQRQHQDRVSGLMTLGVVASRLACESMGWRLTRTTGESFQVRGSCA